MKKIVFWRHYGCGNTSHVLTRFRNEGHGDVFSDESPFSGTREAAPIMDFILMREKDGVLLFLSRDSLVIDLVSLLAQEHGIEVAVLPQIPVVKFDPEWHGGGERVLNLDEEFDEVVKAMKRAEPYESVLKKPKDGGKGK